MSVVPATEDSAHDERPRTAMSREEYHERLLAFMAFKEAAARMGKVLQGADVDGADLPPELESAIQAALNGQALDLSPAVNELLMEFLMSPYCTNGFQIAEVWDTVERDDDTETFTQDIEASSQQR